MFLLSDPSEKPPLHAGRSSASPGRLVSPDQRAHGHRRRAGGDPGGLVCTHVCIVLKGCELKGVAHGMADVTPVLSLWESAVLHL